MPIGALVGAWNRVPSGIPAPIVDVNFNTNPGTPYGFTSVTDTVPRLAVAAGAGMAGSAYGLNVVVNTANTVGSGLASFAALAAPVTSVRGRFYFDPNSVAMTAYTELVVCIGRSASSYGIWAIGFRWTGATYQMEITVAKDDNSLSTSGFVAITDAPHLIEFLVNKAATDSSADGSYQWWIDGTDKGTTASIQTFTKFAGCYGAYFGHHSGSGGAAGSGAIFLDELIVRKDNLPIGAA